jgi:hypothetical protein
MDMEYENLDVHYWIASNELKIIVSGLHQVVELLEHLWDERAVVTRLTVDQIGLDLKKEALADFARLPDEHVYGCIVTLMNGARGLNHAAR